MLILEHTTTSEPTTEFQTTALLKVTTVVPEMMTTAAKTTTTAPGLTTTTTETINNIPGVNTTTLSSSTKIRTTNSSQMTSHFEQSLFIRKCGKTDARFINFVIGESAGTMPSRTTSDELIGKENA